MPRKGGTLSNRTLINRGTEQFAADEQNLLAMFLNNDDGNAEPVTQPVVPKAAPATAATSIPIKKEPAINNTTSLAPLKSSQISNAKFAISLDDDSDEDADLWLLTGGKPPPKTASSSSNQSGGKNAQNTVVLDSDSEPEMDLSNGAAHAASTSSTLSKTAQLALANGNTAMECGCCCCEVELSHMATCNEGHLFCFDCISAYVSEMIAGGSSRSSVVKCLSTGDCNSSFPRSELQRALNPKLFDAYERAIDQDLVNSLKQLIPGLVSCPHCPYTVELPPQINELICRNMDCRKVTCRHCQGKAHRGIKCDDVEQDIETKARKRIEEAMSRALLRTCVSCGASFSKDAGCNKMTCKCGVLSCYLCRETIPAKVGYRHFKPVGKCELWTDSSRDDELLIQAAALEAEKQLQREHPDMDFNKMRLLQEERHRVIRGAVDPRKSHEVPVEVRAPPQAARAQAPGPNEVAAAPAAAPVPIRAHNVEQQMREQVAAQAAAAELQRQQLAQQARERAQQVRVQRQERAAAKRLQKQMQQQARIELVQAQLQAVHHAQRAAQQLAAAPTQARVPDRDRAELAQAHAQNEFNEEDIEVQRQLELHFQQQRQQQLQQNTAVQQPTQPHEPNPPAVAHAPERPSNQRKGKAKAVVQDVPAAEPAAEPVVAPQVATQQPVEQVPAPPAKRPRRK